ncbi:MAG: PEP-CTERM sorting domain-containing protein [Verrucomicrobiota bacterium JB023]|nr:PEP-CTERM sorting domain-containing protein [Verrucomicrobiota bacterium JB023]
MNFNRLLLASAVFSHASAATVFVESFESAPGSTYTLSSTFDDGSFDFFGRYAVPDNTNAARDDFQTGWDQAFGIIGQHHNGDGNAAMQMVSIPNIDITDLADLTLTVSLGALNSEPGFNNYESLDDDGLRIYATVDSGARTLVGEFAPNASGASDLYLDTDADGIGDGAILTTALTDFSFDVPGAGDSLLLEFELTTTDSFEPLALDNVRVETIPEPSSTALLGSLALVGLLRRQRK